MPLPLAANKIYDDVDRITEEIMCIADEAVAHIITATRSQEAHDYCQKYLMPSSWGSNVWHAILDDAIRMRKDLENKT